MNPPITYERIAELAYILYVEEGRPEGRAEWHWHRASEILAQPVHLPSDPRSGPDAIHQQINVAVDHRDDRDSSNAVLNVVRSLSGVEEAYLKDDGRFMHISFDARRTNPAAIFDAIEASRSSEQSEWSDPSAPDGGEDRPD